MSEPFMAELRLMTFNWAPKGWAMCNGQLLPINQNQALFSLLGNRWGGNGQVNFALPDVRGRTPIHAGPSHILGEVGGEAVHTITQSEMPMHTHGANASNANGDTNLPGGNLPATAANAYGPAAALTPLEPSSVTNAGGSQPHTNMQPFLPLTLCIALQGIFPSHN